MTARRPRPLLLRPLLFAATLLLAAFVVAGGDAHEGYVTRLEDEPFEDYRLTLLDDIHDGSRIVLIFLEFDGAPAPADTQVSVLLRPLGGAPFDMYLSGIVGGQVVVEDPAAIDLTLADGVFAVEVLDAAAPLRIEFAPGVTIAPGIIFDLGAYPLHLELFAFGDAPGRAFTTRAGELTVADGAVQTPAQLSDEFGGAQFFSASIALPTP